MWIKLARNRFWIAFCVIATVGVLLRDNWSTISAHIPQQTIPDAIVRIFSPEPTYAASNLTTFSNSSWGKQTNKGRLPKPSVFSKKPTNTLLVHSEVARETADENRLQPEANEGGDDLLPVVETGTFIEGRHRFESMDAVKPTINYIGAWLSEAQIVAEYDVASRKWLASGIKGGVLVESDADNGFPEDTHLVFILPEDTRMALYEKYALMVVDKKNMVHPASRDSFSVMDDSVDSSDPIKLEARFDNVRFDNVKSVRLVAAPLTGTNIREPMSAADKRLGARGIYLVPKELREALRRMNTSDDSASDVVITSGTVIVEATNFPSFASTHAVPDAVIVTTGQPITDARDENSATFTLFLPRYMANQNLHIAVYDAVGNTNSESFTSEPIRERETEFAICKTFTFDEFHQSEVKRVIISVW